MKNLLFLSLAFILSVFVVMQTGCTDDPKPNENTDVTASPYTLSGTLKYRQADTSGIRLIDWNYGPGILRVTTGGKTVATAALQSNGNFMVILPGTVAGNQFTNLKDIAIAYGGTITASPETVKYVSSTQFVVDYTENNAAKSITINQVIFNYNYTIFRYYYYYFYDAEGSLAGTGTAGNVFNWAFAKGWGIVESNMSTGATYVISSKSVNAASASAVWSN